jgi:hypothetical protein
MHAYHHHAVKATTTTCPTCLKPAEIVDRFTLASTDGPAEHIKVRCSNGHVYTLLVDEVQSLRLAS